MTDVLTDWNDLHVTRGIDAVRAQVLAQLESGNVVDARQLDSGKSDNVLSTPENAARDSREWMDGLARNADKNGNPTTLKPTVGNFEMILSHDTRWSDAFRYCDFSYKVIKRDPPVPEMLAGEWEDADTARLRVWFGQNWGITPSTRDALDALIVVAQKRRFHPVREYLQGIVWDGQTRLDAWLVDALGAVAESGPDYLAAAGRKFLVGAVARIMRPGCKMDYVLILEGVQGRGKSKSVAALFGEWYSDAPLPLGDKDAYQNIQGVWGHEEAELDAFSKTENTTAKRFFSQMRDRYRPSYGHAVQDFPRQCVFIGTTNQDEYLKDYTGNRRYWPVRCTNVRAAWVAANRDQLWAEALHLYSQGVKWWPENDDEKRLFEREQDERLQLDLWHYRIEDYLRALPNMRDYVTADEIVSDAVKVDTKSATRQHQMRISPIMKALGWTKQRKRVMCEGGKERQRHVYVAPEGWDVNATSDWGDDDLDLPG